MCVSHAPRARLAVVVPPAAACRAPRWTRGAPPRRLSAGSQTFSSGRLHGSDGSGKTRTLGDGGRLVDGGRVLAHLEGENDSLRNKDEKVKWWPSRAGGSGEGDGDDETDGRTERARASRACRRVTLSARLSSGMPSSPGLRYISTSFRPRRGNAPRRSRRRGALMRGATARQAPASFFARTRRRGGFLQRVARPTETQWSLWTSLPR